MTRQRESAERRFIGIVSGEARGFGPSLVRAALAAAEPFYAGAVTLRNKLFDWGIWKTHRLPRPVISVGNLTTGGTGKTPIVAWLARRLVECGRTPAVLTRGYRKQAAATSDEAEMLRAELGDRVPIIVGADRAAAAKTALRDRPEIDVFIMDDGFQHRRLHRDLDLVLIDATNPFGFDRVLPRGLLREPAGRGLRSASAIIVTRCEQVDEAKLRSVVSRAQRTPIFRSTFQTRVDQALQGKRVFAFAGIGNPAAFRRSLQRAGATVAGERWFDDHHEYTSAEIEDIRKESSADVIVTTAKDAVKLARFGGDRGITVARLDVRIDNEPAFWSLVESTIVRKEK
jgi:tetraacyldisaccharide 4'-kinase